MFKLDFDQHLIPADECQLIATTVSQLIDQCQADPTKLNVLTIEAAGLMQSVATRSEEALQKNWLFRTFNHLTGKTGRMNLESAADLARLLAITQQCLSELEARHLFTQQGLMVLGNHIDLLQTDVNRLQQGMIQTQDQIKHLYQQVLRLAKDVGQRLDKLESRDALHTWRETLTTRRPVWNEELSYAKISLPAKLVCLANDFLHKTEGQWNGDDWYLPERCLQILGIDPEALVEPSILYLAAERDELLAHWLGGIVESDQLDNLANPATTPLAFAYHLQSRYRHQDRHVIDHLEEEFRANGIAKTRQDIEWKQVVKHMQQHAGRALDQAVPVHTLLSELIGNLFALRAYSGLGAALTDACHHGESSAVLNEGNSDAKRTIKNRKPSKPRTPKNKVNSSNSQQSPLSTIAISYPSEKIQYLEVKPPIVNKSALVVEREWCVYFNRAVTIHIYLNNKQIMSIANGATGNFPVKPGKHHMRVIADRFIYNSTLFEETLEFFQDESILLIIDSPLDFRVEMSRIQGLPDFVIQND